VNPLGHKTGLYTDYYEFTMAQGYYLAGKASVPACFDYFFRSNPFDGGYVVFAGLDDLLTAVEHYVFEAEEMDYFASLGFNAEFLKFLKTFRFRGTIASVREGEVVFPLEPIVRIEGTIIETQLVETILLNLLNFESLIATKASRLRLAAGEKRIVDFGLRRAQGLGGMQATRAAIIGGVDATSNVSAALAYGLEVSGTQAHSWIQSFDSELAAFRKFAEVFPDRTFLLVDTYDTLRSGLPNAITVAKELERSGKKLLGIRLDSGDLAYLSKHARAMLDQSGLGYVKIVASNQLDEYVIRSLQDQGAPIDAFGVGTRLVTGQATAALDGVYKLSAFDGQPRLKFSENFSKITLPGVKAVRRFYDQDGMFYADGIGLASETALGVIHHPMFTEARSSVREYRDEHLMRPVMKEGTRIVTASVEEAAATARARLDKLHAEHKRFENPHVYKVGISDQLLKLRTQLIDVFYQSHEATGGEDA
jgi:nicotinate phosphoribosyltransferase